MLLPSPLKSRRSAEKHVFVHVYMYPHQFYIHIDA